LVPWNISLDVGKTKGHYLLDAQIEDNESKKREWEHQQMLSSETSTISHKKICGLIPFLSKKIKMKAFL